MIKVTGLYELMARERETYRDDQQKNIASSDGLVSRKRRVDLEIDDGRRHNHGAGKVPDNCNVVGLDSIRRYHDKYS